VKFGGSAHALVTPQNIRRNNSARELSAFAESAMAVNRVVLQHMSINIIEDAVAEEEAADVAKQQLVVVTPASDHAAAAGKENTADKKRKVPPLGLSPPSESKILQRRRQSVLPAAPLPVLSVSCCLERRAGARCHVVTADAVKSNLLRAVGAVDGV
jgi:hypothetical protein